MEGLVYSRPHLSSFVLPISTSFRLMIPSSKGTLPQKANKFIMCSSQQQVSSEPIIEKRRSSSAYYKPNVRSYEMLKSLDNTHDVVEMQEERIEELEKEVRDALIHGSSYDDALAVLELIDDIQKLGLSYRFEEDIGKTLRSLSQRINGDQLSKTLHAVSINFRIRRQHGLDASQDAFKRFMDSQGNFMDNDVKGMLSLYEAAHLATEGEHVLKEAKAFATKQLQCFVGTGNNRTMSRNLQEQVNDALENPLHRRLPLQQAQSYIKAYSRRPNADGELLELATFEFNMLQSIYKEDLLFVSRWWESTGLTKKLSFARDRPVECFLWALGMAQHPHLSNCRRQLSKVASFVTVIDDIYDVYGSPDELNMFTAAVERWDIHSVNDLPDYMKLCFLALYNTANEIAYDALKDHGVNIVPYLAKSWADLFKAFLEEAMWCKNKTTPEFWEYLKNGSISSSGHVLQAHSYFLTTPRVTKEALESLRNYDDVLPWPSTVLRLSNDLATSSAELERGETANSVSCYMLETRVSEEDARKHMNELIDMSWRKMNKYQCGYDSKFDRSFLQIAFNLARTAHFMYQNGDGHGDPDSKSNKHIHSLIFEPI